MNDPESEWQILAGKLRQELYQYGALFKMLDEQFSCLMRRDSEGIMGMSGKMENQCRHLASLRKEREEFAAALGRQHGLRSPVAVKDLVVCFPPATRPLVEALIEEVNRLVEQTRLRLKKNQLLFSRAREMEQHLLAVFHPAQPGTTYTSGGASRSPTAAGRVNYQRLV